MSIAHGQAIEFPVVDQYTLQGDNFSDAIRGQADGQEKGDNRQASRGGSKNGKVGNAAVSNYPGKVRSKLARVARSVRAKGRGEVVVAFAVGSNGSVRSPGKASAIARAYQSGKPGGPAISSGRVRFTLSC